MPFTHLPGVVATVEPLAVRFVEAGYRLYLVGGIVRDQWLDHALNDSSDIDLTTDAHPTAIKELVADLADALWTQGERFGTIGLRFVGRAIEITTHRAEHYESDSRKPAVAFGDDIAVDLSRRDFTVNAMALEVPDGHVVDPFGGITDLQEQRLRTPLAADISFTDDPLRMLRAARFSARFGLEPTAELTAAATELRDRLRIVAIERIGDELERLFALPDPSRGVEFLIATGLAGELLAWGQNAPVVLDQVDGVQVGRIVSRVRERDWRARLAAFLLLTVAEGEIPDAVGRLRLSRDDRRAVTGIAAAAAQVPALDRGDDGQLRRWHASCVHHDLALQVAAARAETDEERVTAIVTALAALEASDQLATPDLLDGAAIMALLDLSPGPHVGQAVDVLRQAFLDHGPQSHEAQVERLRTWWVAEQASSGGA